jgi:hypothetical protein
MLQVRHLGFHRVLHDQSRSFVAYTVAGAADLAFADTRNDFAHSSRYGIFKFKNRDYVVGADRREEKTVK